MPSFCRFAPVLILALTLPSLAPAQENPERGEVAIAPGKILLFVEGSRATENARVNYNTGLRPYLKGGYREARPPQYVDSGDPSDGRLTVSLENYSPIPGNADSSRLIIHQEKSDNDGNLHFTCIDFTKSSDARQLLNDLTNDGRPMQLRFYRFRNADNSTQDEEVSLKVGTGGFVPVKSASWTNGVTATEGIIATKSLDDPDHQPAAPLASKKEFLLVTRWIGISPSGALLPNAVTEYKSCIGTTTRQLPGFDKPCETATSSSVTYDTSIDDDQKNSTSLEITLYHPYQNFFIKTDSHEEASYLKHLLTEDQDTQVQIRVYGLLDDPEITIKTSDLDYWFEPLGDFLKASIDPMYGLPGK